MDERRYFAPKEIHKLVLESESLRVVVLPEIGFKIASIYYKEKNFELLTMPAAFKEKEKPDKFWHDFMESDQELYRMAYPGAPFKEYDISGINDCIPTIAECEVPGIGHFNDHGDAWSRPWNVFEEDQTACSVKAFFRLSMIPLYFERHIYLKEKTLLLEYRLLNESVIERPWMWTLNNLCHFDPQAGLELPKFIDESRETVYFDAITEKAVDLDPLHMSNIIEGSAFKLFAQKPVSEGKASILYPGAGVKYSINWDPELFPYLGIWINNGGSPGKRTISLQPTNGFYDRLDRAIKNDKVGKIGARQEIKWSISLDLEDV